MTTVRNSPFRASDGRFAPKPLRWWQKLIAKLLVKAIR